MQCFELARVHTLPERHKMAKLIFILEDNEDLRELYRYILEDEDYDITTFSTVSEFMEHSIATPDLYLLDVMLPDGDGIELCKELKKDSRTANIPVIMVSAHQDIADVKLQCPDSDFIAKPFDISHLSDQIARRING